MATMARQPRRLRRRGTGWPRPGCPRRSGGCGAAPLSSSRISPRCRSSRGSGSMTRFPVRSQRSAALTARKGSMSSARASARRPQTRRHYLAAGLLSRSQCRTPAPCATPSPASPWPPATASACLPAPGRARSHHLTAPSRAAGEATSPMMVGRPRKHRGPRIATSEHPYRSDTGHGPACEASAGTPGTSANVSRPRSIGHDGGVLRPGRRRRLRTGLT